MIAIGNGTFRAFVFWEHVKQTIKIPWLGGVVVGVVAQ